MQRGGGIHERRSAGTTAIGPGIFKSRPSYLLRMRTQRNVLFLLPRDGALSVFGGDRRLFAVFLCAILLNPTDCFKRLWRWSRLLHTGWRNTLLLPSVHLQASSVSAGVSNLRVWQTHVATNTHTHTHTHTLSFCVYAAGHVCIWVRPRQRVWSVWTVAGLSLFCFGSDFFSSGNSPIFSQFDFCG